METRTGLSNFFAGAVQDENGRWTEKYLTWEEADVKFAEMTATLMHLCEHMDDMDDPEKCPEAIGMYY